MKSRMFFAAVAVLLVVAAGASAVPVNTLTLYYSFDNVGGTVADESGNGYDGTIYGDVTPYANGISGGCAVRQSRIGLH